MCPVTIFCMNDMDKSSETRYSVSMSECFKHLRRYYGPIPTSTTSTQSIGFASHWFSYYLYFPSDDGLFTHKTVLTFKFSVERIRSRVSIR
ncbi:hypothetical protein ABKN59_005493 [Abortiporus biennis]